MKWIRDYEITITTPEGTIITVEPPFSIHFRVNRNALASANRCNLTIYNLGPNTRNQIFKDRYTIAEYWQLEIKAGYKKLETVFLGNMYQSYSFKQGPDWLSNIQGFDGLNAIQNGFTSTTVEKGTSQRTVVQNIIKDMPNVVKGLLGTPADGSNERGKVLMGQSADLLSIETGGKYFIDNEVVNVLDGDEVKGGQILLLDSDQLFTTPKRRDAVLDCDVLFIPEASIALFCQLDSKFKIYNGTYKVIGFTHDVTISQAISGNAKTTITLYAGAEGLREVAV